MAAPQAQSALPFQDAVFFDRFKPGETILYLQFIGRTPDDASGSAMARSNGGHLVQYEILGIYGGRSGMDITIDPVSSETAVIPAKDVRGFKEFDASKLANVLAAVSKAMSPLFAVQKRGDRQAATIAAINSLRDLNAVNTILMPNLRPPL